MAKQTSKVSAERAKLFKATNFNPIKGLTPAKLVTQIDGFKRGLLRAAALTWQTIMDRDDQVKTCHPKRTRNVTGLNWEILPIDDSDAAQAHKETLERFYNNLTCYHGLNENERGGMRLLIKHMMTAVGLYYACFEIIWKPGAGKDLTADFKFLPLQFFENTEGKLRFLKSDYDLYGVDLDEFFGEGGWMIATGEGIMEASSIAWMFKNMPLKAWVTYCEKFGIPGLHGKTSAAKGSEEWNGLVSALAAFGEDLALVTNQNAEINPIEQPNGANQPHPPLVERMDRAISRLWLGGDLATMSAAGGAVGSQPQSDDIIKLQEDDAAMITDTLQYYVDRRVIEMVYGATQPLAYFKLKPPARTDVEREVKTDEFLIKAGAKLGIKDLLERYGRAEADEGEEIATLSAGPSAFPAINDRRAGAVNEDAAKAFRAKALAELSAARAEAFRPLIERLNAVLALPDDQLTPALEKFRAEMPTLAPDVLKDPASAKAWEKILASALVSGAAEGRAKLKQASSRP